MSLGPERLSAALAASLLVSACGSDPFCGDGKQDFDLGEQCDDGNSDETDVCLANCMLRPVPQLTLKWEFNQDFDRGFQGDSCFDVGAARVSVRLTGPGTDRTDEADCSFRQVRYQDIPSGMYMAAVSVAGEAGESLLTMPHMQAIVFSGGTGEEVVAVVPPPLWSTPYLGTFFFRLGWGEMGDSCELASPIVVDNNLLLELGGAPYPGVTDVGHPVDGSAFTPCRPLSEGAAQAVLSVPFGPAEFTVSGRTGAGVLTFSETFSTFVGAGINNPELRFSVSILPGLDGGPDAAID